MATTVVSQVNHSALTPITTFRRNLLKRSSFHSLLPLRSYQSRPESIIAQAFTSRWGPAEPTKRNKLMIARSNQKDHLSVVDKRKVKETMEFYVHEIRSADPSDTNATLKLANLPPNTAPLQWGTSIVFDNEVREGEGADSKLLGREQGWGYVTDKNSAEGVQVFCKISFTDGIHAGSTLTVTGNVAGATTPYELIILGGTGHFRGAHGFVLADNSPNQGARFLFHWNVYIMKDNVGLL